MQVNYKTDYGLMKCKLCKKEIIRKARNQMYCLDCGRKKDLESATKIYRERTKPERDRQKETPPQFYCDKCKFKIQLDFLPLGTWEERKRWLEYRCPSCGKNPRP